MVMDMGLQSNHDFQVPVFKQFTMGLFSPTHMLADLI